jgi:hypothetical protein
MEGASRFSTQHTLQFAQLRALSPFSTHARAPLFALAVLTPSPHNASGAPSQCPEALPSQHQLALSARAPRSAEVSGVDRQVAAVRFAAAPYFRLRLFLAAFTEAMMRAFFAPHVLQRAVTTAAGTGW